MDKDKLQIGLNGEDFEVSRDNTSVFRYLGGAAMYNHVFLIINRHEDGTAEATHVFEQLLPEAYEALEQFAVEHSFPQHINLLEVAECDVDAFNSSAYRDLNDQDLDKLLDDWEKDAGGN